MHLCNVAIARKCAAEFQEELSLQVNHVAVVAPGDGVVVVVGEGVPLFFSHF